MKALSSTALSRLFVIGLNAIFGIIAARLRPTDKGLFSFATLVPSLTTTVALLAGPQLIISSGATISRLVGSARRLLPISIALSLLFAVISGVFLSLREEGPAFGLFLVPFVSPLLVLVEYALSVTQASLRFFDLAVMRVLQALLPGLGYSLGAWTGGLEGALLGFTIGTGVLTLVARPWRYLQDSPTVTRIPWKFVLSTSASLVILSLMYRVDVLILGLRSTEDQVGYYTTAVSLTELSLIGSLSLAVVRAPHYVRGRSQLLKDSIVAVLTVVITMIPILAVHSWLIPLVFGDSYVPSSELIFPMSIGMVALGAFRFISAIELVLRHSNSVFGFQRVLRCKLHFGDLVSGTKIWCVRLRLGYNVRLCFRDRSSNWYDFNSPYQKPYFGLSLIMFAFYPATELDPSFFAALRYPSNTKSAPSWRSFSIKFSYPREMMPRFVTFVCPLAVSPAIK